MKDESRSGMERGFRKMLGVRCEIRESGDSNIGLINFQNELLLPKMRED